MKITEDQIQVLQDVVDFFDRKDVYVDVNVVEAVRDALKAELDRMTTRTRPKFFCEICGSEDLLWDAWAQQDPHTGEMELAADFENCHCPHCDGETRAVTLEELNVEPETEL